MHQITTPAWTLARSPILTASFRSQWPLWLALATGLVFTMLNIQYPVTRNAAQYAHASLSIIAHNFDLLEVINTTDPMYRKPILFSLLAAPFTWMFNARVGTVIASAIGTAAFLWMAQSALTRLSHRTGASAATARLSLVLVAFNPVVISQFWSGYPDSLLAAFMLAAFVLVDIVAREPLRDTRWHIAGLGLVMLLAVHTKLYAAVLGLACPLYLLMHWRSLARSPRIVSKTVLLLTVLGVLAAVILAATFSVNPLLKMEVNAGSTLFVLNDVSRMLSVTLKSMTMLGITALLVFNFVLVFFLSGHAWRHLPAAPVVFFMIYVAGLLPFWGTTFNMRYFLPVLPLLAFALAQGASSFRIYLRRTSLGLYAATAALLVITFNVAAIDEAFQPTLAQVLGKRHRFLENLRLGTQRKMLRQIETINANVAPGDVLYWSSPYPGLAESVGVRPDIDIRNVRFPWEIPPTPTNSFLTQFSGHPQDEIPLRYPPDWSVVTKIGSGVFRLEPFYVECVPVTCDSLSRDDVIRLRVHPGISTTHAVDLFDGTNHLATLRSPPFEFTWTAPALGRHEIEARMTSRTGETIASPAVSIFTGETVIQRTVTRSTDVVSGIRGGYLMIGDFEPLTRPYTVIRFGNIPIPPGPRIAHAYIEFTYSDHTKVPAEMEIRTGLGSSRTENLDIARPASKQVVHWPAPTIGKQRLRSPDLSAIIQEITSRPEWRQENSLIFFLEIKGYPIVPSPKDPYPKPTLFIHLQ